MRIHVHAEGFQLTSELRDAVVSRLMSTLGRFGAHIQFVIVRLRAGVGQGQPDTALCEIAVRLHPTADVRARAEDAQMAVAIERAANDIRDAVEREVSRLQSVPSSVSPLEEHAGSNALEVVLDDNEITQQQRECLEKPENYLRPIRVREYWAPPGEEAKEVPKERDPALAVPPREADLSEPVLKRSKRRRTAATHEPSHAEIQQRAYYRYVDRGRIDGFDREDWRLAETELRGGEQPAVREIDEHIGVRQAVRDAGGVRVRTRRPARDPSDRNV